MTQKQLCSEIIYIRKFHVKMFKRESYLLSILLIKITARVFSHAKMYFVFVVFLCKRTLNIFRWTASSCAPGSHFELLRQEIFVFKFCVKIIQTHLTSNNISYFANTQWRKELAKMEIQNVNDIVGMNSVKKVKKFEKVLTSFPTTLHLTFFVNLCNTYYNIN